MKVIDHKFRLEMINKLAILLDSHHSYSPHSCWSCIDNKISLIALLKLIVSLHLSICMLEFLVNDIYSDNSDDPLALLAVFE